MFKRKLINLQGKGLITHVNKLLRIFSLKLSSEYQIQKSAEISRVKYLFSLIRPVTTGHTLTRIGPKNDGGYLVPNDLSEVKYCFSPGVGGSYLFEQNLSEYGISSFLTDPSVKLPQVISEKIWFDQTAITVASGDKFSFEMFDKNYQGTIHQTAGLGLQDWINSKIDSSEKDLILQLDIEGGEYLTLLSTPINFLKRFRILVVEFHSFHRVRNDYFLENIAIPVFEKLERVFDIVHLHPNNDAQSIPFLSYYLPHALEVTFHNKERRISRPLLRQFIEHDLDNPTVQNNEDVIFDSKLFS